jgi:GNAT superfamily N-acetyltransferase
MSPIIIRKAMLADLEALLRFQQGVVQTERPFDPTLQEGAIHYYDIPRMLESDEVEFLLATSGATPVGCGFARIERSKAYLRHAHHAYLGLMYVEPAYRGTGVIGKILGSLKQWCRIRNVAELRLEVYPDNRAAVRAYERAGFDPLYLHMRMHLNDE